MGQRLDSVLDNYYNNYAPERIHLQTDRGVYGPGETIWFKAYIMAAFIGSGSSKNLYIDWTDRRGKILAHQIYPISQQGISCGLFDIPHQYAQGTLHIRAYTKWMLNDDSAFLYNKEVRIIAKRPTRPTGSQLIIHPTLTLFPEGGNTVVGIGSKIAFLCCDQWGRPVKVKGEVKDGDGNKVADIITQHDGMGTFWLMPLQGQSYIAEWKDDQNEVHQTPLQAAQTEGVVMGISDQGDKKKFTITRSAHVPNEEQALHIVATMQQKPVYMATVNLKEQSAAIGLIPETGLRAGGMVVTVFNNDWKPLTERICFVSHLKKSTFSAKLKWEKKNLNSRGYNQLLITIPDSIPANMSISVTDAGLPTDSINNQNILSELLLAGDLRGRVYNQDYYFTDTTEEIKHHLDLVMMTHGWRRYDWNKIVKGIYPTFRYPRDTSYYTLSGKITGISEKRLSNAGSLFLILKDKDSSVQSQIAAVDKEGKFEVPSILLFDSTHLYYRFTGKKDPSAYINFNLNKPQMLLSAPITPVIQNNLLSGPIADTSRDSILKDFIDQAEVLQAEELATITVTTHKKSMLDKMDDLYVNNPLFRSSNLFPSYAVDVAHDKTAQAYPDIYQFLKGKIPGYPLGPKWEKSVIFVDEVPNSPIPSIQEIAYVKAFPSPFAGAPFNGSAIAIYTKKANDLDTESEPMPSIFTKGYTPLKQFYLPNYGAKESSNQDEDIRPTIYWNPILLTNSKANKVRLSFYNNDISKSFRVVLEGTNDEGKITHVEELVN